MKILVRNLDRKTTAAEITSAFERHGRVESCSLVMDKATGKSKGFGFVFMDDDKEADSAIKALNATQLGGEKIRVKKAAPDQS